MPTLPGVEWLLPLVSRPRLLRSGDALARRLGRAGLPSGPDVEEPWRGYVSLGDAGSRRAFLATIRTLVDPGRQTVSTNLDNQMAADPTGAPRPGTPRTTDANIELIAARTGMGTAATLRRHFNRLLGVPPEAYRRTFRNDRPSAPARPG